MSRRALRRPAGCGSRSRLRRVGWAFAIALLGALVLPPVRGALLSAAGLHLYVVESGSMSPALGVGDAIVVRELGDGGRGGPRVGDVITFAVEGGSFGTVTHRIVSVEESPSGERYRTKGDANRSVDAAPVARDRIVGEVVARIPRIGRLSRVPSSIPVVSAFVALCGVVLIAGGAEKPRRRTVPKGREQQPTEGSAT